MNDVLQESNKIYCGLYCTLFASLAGGFVISHSHARPPFVKIDMADMAYGKPMRTAMVKPVWRSDLPMVEIGCSWDERDVQRRKRKNQGQV